MGLARHLPLGARRVTTLDEAVRSGKVIGEVRVDGQLFRHIYSTDKSVDLRGIPRHSIVGVNYEFNGNVPAVHVKMHEPMIHDGSGFYPADEYRIEGAREEGFLDVDATLTYRQTFGETYTKAIDHAGTGWPIIQMNSMYSEGHPLYIFDNAPYPYRQPSMSECRKARGAQGDWD